jgi:AraC-like DNA-binding protein
VELHDDGTWAAWAYQVEDPTVWPRVQDCELSMAVMCSLFRARLGPKWSPREVHFEHTGADPDATLRTFFRARIMFGRPVTQIVFETRDLDRELIVEGADITSVLERHADDLLAQQRGQQREAERPLTARVSRLIGAQLSREQITVAGVARAFGMSARTLQRELANEGTTLRALLREHRQTLAEARLTEGASSHGAIAQAMGYSDGTVFWRAFKRWSGKSPRAFRARVDDGGFERKK